jgi:hypothetical protein
VTRADAWPLQIIWVDGDVFSGEDAPPVVVEWPWSHPAARVVDAFGAQRRVTATDGKIRIEVSVTPVFLSL